MGFMVLTHYNYSDVCFVLSCIFRKYIHVIASQSSTAGQISSNIRFDCQSHDIIIEARRLTPTMKDGSETKKSMVLVVNT